MRRYVMRNVITFLDVAEPVDGIHPGGIVVLKGDAPVWMYCNLFHKCIMEGSAVIAIAHGIDTSTSGGDSIVAFSIDPDYQIGKTIGDAEKEYTEKRLANPSYLEEKQAAMDAGNKTLCGING